MKHLIKSINIGLLLGVALVYAGATKEVVPPKVKVIEIPTVESSPWYVGVGLNGIDFLKDPCSKYEPTCRYEDVTYGIMARGGRDFNPYFGIEGRVAKTFLDKGPYGGVPVGHIGIFLKPQYPLSERWNLYGLAGYGYTKNLGNGARLKYLDSDTGFSAGAGIEYDLSDADGDFVENANYDRKFDGYADQGKGWMLFADYQKLLIKSSELSVDMVSVGVRYDF